MADGGVVITELLIDAGPALAGADQTVKALEGIATASQKAVDSVDRLGGTLDAIGTIGNRSRSSVSDVDALSTALQRITAQQDQLRSGVSLGNISSSQAATLAELAEQAQRLSSAMAQLREGTGASADTLERLPQAFSIAARGATTLSDAVNSLDQTYARAQAGLSSLISKYDPATASARQMTSELAALNEAQRAGIVSATQYADVYARIVDAYNPSIRAAQQAAEAQARLTATAREAQTALNSQQGLNDALGVDRIAKSAADSAAFFREVADAEKQVADASQVVTDRLAQLTARFDPATTSARQMAAEIGTLNEAQRLGVNIAGGYDAALAQIQEKYGQLTRAATDLMEAQSRAFSGTSGLVPTAGFLDANVARRAAAGPQEITAGAAESQAQAAIDAQSAYNALLGVTSEVNKSASESATVFEKAAKAQEAMAASAQQIKDQLNPLAAFQRAWNEELVRLNALLNAGVISQDQYNIKAREALKTFSDQSVAAKLGADALKENANAARTASEMHGGLATSLGLPRAGMMELEHVTRAMTDAINAGIPPLTALRLEMPRIFEAFSISAGGALFSLPVIGLAALAGAIYVIGTRAAEVSTNLRTFTAGAELMGTSSLASGADLQRTTENLRDMGIGAEGALKIVNELRLNPIINPAAIQTIGELGAKLSAIQTGSFSEAPEKAKELATALQGGLGPLTDYAIKIGAITGAQAAGFIEEARYKGSLEESNAVFALIKAHLDATDAPLSDFQRAMIEARKTWNEFIDDLVKEGALTAFNEVFKFVLTEVKSFVVDVKNLITEIKTIYEDVKWLIPGGGAPRGPTFGSGFTPGEVTGTGGTLQQAITRVGNGGGLLDPYIPSLNLGAYFKSLGNYLSSPELLRGFGSVGQSISQSLPAGTEDANTTAVKDSAEKTKDLSDATKNLTEAITKQVQATTLPPGSATGAGGAPLGIGGAIAGAGLFGAIAQLESGGRNITQQIQDANSRAGTPAQGIFQITDPTWRQFASPEILAQYKSAIEAPLEIQQQVAANIPLMRWGPRTVAGIQSQFGPLDTSQTIGALAGGGGGLPPSVSGPFAGTGPIIDVTGALGGTAGGGASPAPLGQTAAGLEAFNKIIATTKDEEDRRTEATKLGGTALQEYNIRQSALTKAVADGANADQAQTFADNAVNAQRDRNAATLDRETQLRKLQTQTQLDSIAASRQGEAAAIAEEALGKARENDFQRGAANIRNVTSARSAAFAQESDAARQSAQNLQVKAASDANAASKTILAMDVQIAADQRLAIATARGAAEGKQAALDNQANAITHNAATTAVAAHMVAEVALAKAIESGDEKRKAQAQELVDSTKKTMDATAAERDLAAAKLAGEAAAKNAVSLDTATNNLKDQVAQEQLVISLQGQTTEQISAQLEILKAQQKVKNDNINLDKGIADAQASGNTKLADELTVSKNLQSTAEQRYTTEVAIDTVIKQQEADAQRAQQRLNSAVSSVASEIQSQIGTALDNAFSGQKAVSWGETMKTILRDLLKQIVEFALIQPAIGTALSALGFKQVAQQFGSFSSLFGGGGGGGIDPVSGLSNSTTSGGGSGILGDLGNGISAISKIGNLFGGGGNSGGGFLSGIGSLFGASTDVGASIAGTGGLTSQALLDAPGSFAGAFGETFVPAATEATTALSSAGVDAAVSGAGALGGAGGAALGAIGAAIPYVGAAIAVGTLLSSILGNHKPSLASSGDVIDLSSGTASGFASSGNAQNDASVNSITGTIRQFEQTLQQETGGSVPGGALNIVQTLKGVEVNYAGELGNIHAKFADAQSAINAVETVLAQNMSGISDTMKTVLAHITDPGQIQAAVQFAATYDNLQKAVDASLKGVAGDIQTAVGPFATAMDTVRKQFATLTQQAQQFGLSLDPINQGLALATTRLQEDFGRSLDTIIAGSGSNYVGQLQQVGATFATNVTDAIAIGLGSDSATSGKIAQAESVQAQAILGQLTAPQLQDVITKLGTTNPEIAAMAQVILTAGVSATAATGSVQNFASQLQALQATITALSTGNLSGLPPAAAADAAVKAYQQELAKVQGGNTNEIGNLSTSASAAVTALQTAYGNAPQTSDQRTQILAQLNAVLASNPQPGVAATPAVTAAQAAQAAAAAQNSGALNLNPQQVGKLWADVVAGTATPDEKTKIRQAAAQGLLPADQAAALPSYEHLQGFAEGTSSTPPGWILVGERGPELINQSGGAQVLPISSHSAYQWRGPAFASGTGGGSDVLEELRALRSEVAMLRQVHLGVGTETVKVAQSGNKILGDINRKAGTGLPMPARQNISVK